jgi:hypothetical protein
VIRHDQSALFPAGFFNDLFLRSCSLGLQGAQGLNKFALAATRNSQNELQGLATGQLDGPQLV